MTDRHLLRWICALTIALGCSAGRALAEPTAAERETARSLMDEADRLRASGDHWGALERYKAADQLMHVPTTGLELARMQATILQLVEARATALSTGNLPVVEREPKIYAQARAEAHKLAASLEPRIPDVTVSVEPQAAGARVSIDGSTLPKEALALAYKLNPGGHVISVTAAGYESSSQQISLAEGQHAQLHIALRRVPELVGSAGTEVAAASAVAATAPAKPEPQLLEDSNEPGRIRGYVGLSVGGTLLVVGTVTGIISLARTVDVKNSCNEENICAPAVRDDIGGSNALANVANVTLALGAVGAAYGLIELLLHRDERPEQAAHRRVQLGVNVVQPGILVRGAL